MLASTPALTSEFTPNRTKDFWISFVLSGYPLGAVGSGLVAAEIIPHHGWRAMFQIAGIATLTTLPFIYFLLAESLDFLIKTQPKNALKRVNQIMIRMKLERLESLPQVEEERTKTSVTSLFSGQRKNSTIRLWIAFFMSFAALYFLLSWIPKLATNTGLTLELAIYAGTVFNLGSFAGILTQGYFSGKYGLRRVISSFLFGSATLMIAFGLFSSPFMILFLFGLIGFAMQGGFVGLYSVAARLYHTEIRTTGIGWAAGAGRSGAIVGPLLGGMLIGAGFSMTLNFIIFAIPMIVAGIATLLISSKQIS